MDFKLCKEQDFNISNWSGGTTKQLAIYPETAVYADRDFIWRLSSATCDLDESDFTDLPDYNRVLAVLHGEVVLAYEGKRTVKLGPLDYDYFDGADRTKSFGKCTDYNLMTRKGYNGRLEVIELTSESNTLEVAPALSRGFFCTGGYAVVSFDGNSIMVNEGEQLVINDCPKTTISVMGEGALIHTEVSARPEEVIADDEESIDTDAPEAYPLKGKSNFSIAMMLSITDFRGAKYIFKNVDRYWIDEDMEIGLERIKKLYVSYFLYIIGVSVLASVAMINWTTAAALWIILAWTLLCIFVVSPLIYMAAAPKPLGEHIKDIAYLNKAERELEAERRAANPRLDKLLKKYKNTGIYDYDE